MVTLFYESERELLTIGFAEYAFIVRTDRFFA
jgi:hypothetical protein